MKASIREALATIEFLKREVEALSPEDLKELRSIPAVADVVGLLALEDLVMLRDALETNHDD